jgi:hypothetical protein
VVVSISGYMEVAGGIVSEMSQLTVDYEKQKE